MQEQTSLREQFREKFGQFDDDSSKYPDSVVVGEDEVVMLLGEQLPEAEFSSTVRMCDKQPDRVSASYIDEDGGLGFGYCLTYEQDSDALGPVEHWFKADYIEAACELFDAQIDYLTFLEENAYSTDEYSHGWPLLLEHPNSDERLFICPFIPK